MLASLHLTLERLGTNLTFHFGIAPSIHMNASICPRLISHFSVLAPQAAFVAVMAAWASALCVASPPATIAVDTQTVVAPVNPRMYGIFLEEINHGIDGGLYAELVRNRGFEDARPPEGYQFNGSRWVDTGGFDSGFDEFGYTTSGLPFWETWSSAGTQGKASLQRRGGISEASSYCARLEVVEAGEEGFGIANQGFFGIGVREGEEYTISLNARHDGTFDGQLTVRLVDSTGASISNAVHLSDFGGEWQELTGKLTATKTSTTARLLVTADAAGTVWLDLVSLFPKKTWRSEPNGMRPDIAQMIADLEPGFVRFPGGCVVEGGTIETAYDWKVTVGPVEQRAERWGPWNHRRTNGMGIYEYLRFCSNLNAEPLWVGFCGQTCIFRNREHVPMDDMQWVRDGFLDLVEYANGPATSEWGQLRAAAGREQPFGLKYIEIGNENQGIEYGRRYQYIHEALVDKYPDLIYLGDLSWTDRRSMRGAHFDIIDRHYYNSPQWFATRYHEYDDRSRDLPPLYLGEVAVTTGEAGPLRGNLLAALSEGVFLLGCEQNADTVQMVSYAPLLANVEGRTALTGSPPPWHAMIYFDGTRVFGTASYHLWKMFATNRPDETIQTSIDFDKGAPMVIAGQFGIGTWDASADFKDIKVTQGANVLLSDLSDDTSIERGRWRFSDGVHSQRRRGFGFKYFGEPRWSDCTLSLKARKREGSEGFLIAFGRKDGKQFWWNLGGWGNSQHAVEWNQTPVGTPVRGRIESDRWYDIKIELSGDQIRCYLDGELVHDLEFQMPKTLFVNAGRLASGDTVLKAINLGDEPQQATWELTGLAKIPANANVTVLTSDDPNVNNSLENPQAIAPKETSRQISEATFSQDLPPHSFTIIHLAP